MYRAIAHGVYKRAEDSVGQYEIPGWAWAIAFADLLLFLPLIFVIGYTLQSVFPTLAVIEDPSPPAYEPVSLNDDAQSFSEDVAAAVADEAGRGLNEGRAVTSSLRAMYRTLKGISGFSSLFRGLACWIALTFASNFLTSVFKSAWIPALVAAPLAATACVQLDTAWTHIVISAPSPKRWFQRLPPFKKTYQAAALPTVLYFFTAEVVTFVSKGVAYLLGLTMWDLQHPNTVPQGDAHDLWKFLIVILTGLSLTVFLVIPSQVVLTRVQASLLPEEDETIVQFDRTFQGKVEPAIVGGKGFVSMTDAWKTFSRAAWVRLVKLYAKTFLVSMALYALFIAILIPEMYLIIRSSKKIN